MLKRTVALLSVPACAATMAWAAWADEVPDGYLPGTWAVGGTEACGQSGTEHVTFDSDGSFEVIQDGKATAVGFWHRDEDLLDLHMLSSAAFFDDPSTDADDALRAYAGQYQYYYAKGLLFDITPDGFRMVATMGDMLRGANYGRCP